LVVFFVLERRGKYAGQANGASFHRVPSII